VIRLYFDQVFEVGAELLLSKPEWHYYSKVRRGASAVEGFNRFAQCAQGRIENKYFIVESVSVVTTPQHPVTLAVGLPDNSVVSELIRSVSECGLEGLIFFGAQRSQSARKRLLHQTEKWEKLAIESARQCGRGKPLVISASESLQHLPWDQFSTRIFFDENDAGLDAHAASLKAPLLVLVGPEGGWTEEERHFMRAQKCQTLHLTTPVMRVETAAIAASIWSVIALN
jgi:16S rRNA (uracil1498-N3)-methyltransferase